MDRKGFDNILGKTMYEPKSSLMPKLYNTQLNFIEHSIENDKIHQRPKDGYINATELCKKAGKQIKHYLENKSTREYLETLSRSVGIPTDLLIQTINTGLNENRGTWIHPKVAINLGQWVSPKFAVLVSDWVFDWMSGNIKSYMPPHVKRYIKNRNKIPHTHFSMLNEVYLNLFSILEDEGIQIPTNVMPDISTGLMFSKFLRNKGIDVKNFPNYTHEFNDHRPNVNARLYPLEYLSDFRLFFNNDWLPNHCKSYLQDRIPKAMPFISQFLPIE